MNIEILKNGENSIAELVSDVIEIKTVQDALDMMANCRYMGADNIILREENLCPEFFDLKTMVAGEILQKFSNYNMKLAIVGDFEKYNSKSLRDFIYESNKVNRVIFVNDIGEARKRLSK